MPFKPPPRPYYCGETTCCHHEEQLPDMTDDGWKRCNYPGHDEKFKPNCPHMETREEARYADRT